MKVWLLSRIGLERYYLTESKSAKLVVWSLKANAKVYYGQCRMQFLEFDQY